MRSLWLLSSPQKEQEEEEMALSGSRTTRQRTPTSPPMSGILRLGTLALLLLTTSTTITTAQQQVNVYLKPAFESSNSQELGLINSALVNFTATTGINVKVDFAQTAISYEYRLDVANKIKTNSTSYDIYLIEESWTGSFPGAFADLTKLGVDWNSQLQAQQPEVTELDSVNGALVAMPFWADYGVLYYRKDILAQYGITNQVQTWTDIENACNKILASQPPSNLKCFVTGFANESVILSATEWLASSTTTPLIQSGLTFNFQDPEFANILTQIRNWTATGVISPDALRFTEIDALKDWLQGNVIFLQGRTSFYFQTLDVANPNTFPNASGKNLSWGVSVIPGKTPQLTASTVGGYHLAVNSLSGQQQAAAKVVQFLTSEGVQRNRSLNLGLPSAYKASYTATDLCVTRIPCQAILQSQKFVRPAGKVIPHWLQIADVLTADMNLFFSNPGISANVGLLKAENDVSAILGINVTQVSTTSPAPTQTGDPNAGGNNTHTSPFLIIIVVLSLCVFFGIISSIMLIQYRRSGWPFHNGDRGDKSVSGLNGGANLAGGGGLYSRGGPGNNSGTTGEYVSGTVEWAPAADITKSALMSSSIPGAFTNPNSSDYNGSLPRNVRVSAAELNGWGIPQSVSPVPPMPAAALRSPTPQQHQQSTTQRSISGTGSTIFHPSNLLNNINNSVNMTAAANTANNTMSSTGTGGWSSPLPSPNYIRRPTSLEISYNASRSVEELSTQDGSEGYATSNITKGTNANASGFSDSMGSRHVVVHAYEPVQMDEMALVPGETVMLKMAYDDGYAFGEIETPDGGLRSGVFPLACLVPAGDVNHAKHSRRSMLELNGAAKLVTNPNDAPEILLMSGKITEEAYLRIRKEKREKEERQIAALKTRLENVDLPAEERSRLQRRLDELELGL
ncbi:hypothetical protein HDU76_011587 [Blyttiomyces sp. JEL0837]|nr:hypothetical protein HDU76_011587 [Blyttiomyces sp. JEL0837]